MAVQEALTCITLKAAADLSTKQYYAMKVSAANTVNVASAAGEPVIGFLQNKPSAANEAATVAYTGRTKAVAGAAVAAGAYVKVLANGKVDDASTAMTADASGASATAATTGAHTIGIALTAASADGDVIEVLLTHSGAVPGTSA
jgi:hypothetical protein